MSGRLLKKILKDQEQKELLQRLETEQELEDEEEEIKGNSSRSTINPFDLLNDDDHKSEQESESENVGEMLLAINDEKESTKLKSTSSTVVSTSNPKSKKKKRKKNKEGSSNTACKVEKTLDVDLETLCLDANSSSHHCIPQKSKAANTRAHDNPINRNVQSILQVDPKYLNAENELRRIFGSKVVKSFEKSQQTSSSRQIRGGRRGVHIPRKTNIVTPSEHWPRWDGSLSMEFLEVRDGLQYFRYVHSASYSQAQSSFEAAKAIHDLNGMASILMHHPYHLGSLITMADYFKFVGEHQMSADAISKCLYALECAWHPMFMPFQGNCQLKFSEETNKPLFTTLFAHMKNMDRRGCHRSALEVCKLLLSLDSDDPVGVVFCIDYLSLRAEEYEWLEQFSEDYQSDNSLWLFPNFSYSLAVCRLNIEKKESLEATDTASAKASSTELMKQALMLHPSVLKKLVEKVPLKDRAWGDVIKNAFFRADEVGLPSLDHLSNIYVESSYLIWRLPDLQKLLKDAAQLVIETLKNNGSEAKDWACVRKEAFSSEKNEYRHLLVSDFSHTVPTIPPENLQNFMVDPRIMQAVHDENHVANRNDVVNHARSVTNRNALAVLFESILPWVHYENGEGAADEDDQLNGHVPDVEDY